MERNILSISHEQKINMKTKVFVNSYFCFTKRRNKPFIILKAQIIVVHQDSTVMHGLVCCVCVCACAFLVVLEMVYILF